jgi:release factor glutamine methyltransferase
MPDRAEMATSTPGSRRPRVRDVEGAHPDLLAQVAARLAAAGVASPRSDARWLLEHVLAVAGDPTAPEGEPAAPEGDPTAPAGAALLEELVARRAAREPLQFVLGTTAFRTVELLCRPGVFIPRPETEVLAGVAIDAARQAAARQAAARQAAAAGRAAGRGPLVVEPCTGTGAVACSLVAEVPGVRVVATDRDPAAVALATENLRRVVAGEAGADVPPAAHPPSWEVRQGDLLGPVDAALRGHLDVLVANPPYLPASDRGSWAVEVADHDPDAALVGGADGHEVVDALLAAAMTWLAPGGLVAIELDARRADDALRVATRVGLADARLVADLTGAPRIVTGRRPR